MHDHGIIHLQGGAPSGYTWDHSSRNTIDISPTETTVKLELCAPTLLTMGHHLVWFTSDKVPIAKLGNNYFFFVCVGFAWLYSCSWRG